MKLSSGNTFLLVAFMQRFISLTTAGVASIAFKKKKKKKFTVVFWRVIFNRWHMMSSTKGEAKWALYTGSIRSISKVCKVGDLCRGRPEGSLFNSDYNEVIPLSLDCSTLPLICTLYCWVLSKEVSSTIFKVFGMTQPGIEPRSPGPLANTLPTRPMNRL